jgi:nucleotide-binding universal stress UspA family protein
MGVNEMAGYSKILVAVDFSESSDRALQSAIELATRFGAHIDLVHAFSLAMLFPAPYEVTVPDQFLDDAREQAQKKLNDDLAKVQAAEIDARAYLGEVPASASIVKLAEDLASDLVMMGTRGHTGVKHVLLGSVAERTLRHSPCSVLIVK